EDRVYSKQPSANNNLSQKLDGAYSYRGGLIRAGVADAYLNTTDPAFSELVRREQRWQNVLAANAEYGHEGGALFVGIDASQKTDKYLSPALAAVLNGYDQLFGLKAGYWVQPKTRFYSAYHREIIHYSAGRAAHSKS